MKFDKITLLMLYRVGLALAAAAERALREGYGWTPKACRSDPVDDRVILDSG